MIGRASEEKTLNRLYNSGRAEFVAIYVRRRVDEWFDGSTPSGDAHQEQ